MTEEKTMHWTQWTPPCDPRRMDGAIVHEDEHGRLIETADCGQRCPGCGLCCADYRDTITADYAGTEEFEGNLKLGRGGLIRLEENVWYRVPHCGPSCPGYERCCRPFQLRRRPETVADARRILLEDDASQRWEMQESLLILAHEGTLDRYHGHALVAFFGAPVYQPDHALRACRAAIECCDTLHGLEETWQERDLAAPHVHIGLHTGELLVGNITLTTRVDYTVAGENLNIAYRVGELNELYGTEIMISQATWSQCERQLEVRELDLVRIKGRREPIRAYELMSAKGRLSPEQLQLRGAFATGLVAFRNRDYAAALEMFRSCRQTLPGDRPATVYIERCERELSTPTHRVE